MKRYNKIYKKKYESFSVSCVLKLLTTTNSVRFIRFNTKPISEYFFNFCKYSILSRINQDRYCFSHIHELCNTFSSSFRDMTNKYYLKQQMPKCEFRLNQILAKNPRRIYRLNRFSIDPFIRKYTNQEIKFA